MKSRPGEMFFWITSSIDFCASSSSLRPGSLLRSGQPVLRRAAQIGIDQHHAFAARAHQPRQAMQRRRLAFARPGGKNHQRMRLPGLQRQVQVRVQHAERLELRRIVRPAPRMDRAQTESRRAPASFSRVSTSATLRKLVSKYSSSTATPTAKTPPNRNANVMFSCQFGRLGKPRRLGRIENLNRLLRHLEIDFTLPQRQLERGQQPRLVLELLRRLLERPHAFARGEDLVHLRLRELALQLGHARVRFLVGNLERALVTAQLRVELLLDFRAVIDRRRPGQDALRRAAA